MIRFIRLACINLCVLSLIAYIGVNIYSRNNADNTPPKITMPEDEITISVQDETDVIFSDITAEDEKDGDVTRYLTLENLSNFISPGIRTATIAAFDDAGNVSRVTRTVHYSDYVSPRVTLAEPLNAPLSDMSALLDKIQVTDCLDGDITDNLQIVSEDAISGTVSGTYKMHLQVSNSAGDTLDMPVTVVLYTAQDRNSTQVIELTDYLIYVKKGTSVNPLSYLKSLKLYTDTYTWNARKKKFIAEQALTGSADDQPEYETPAIDISEIDIDNPVNTSIPGTYEIQYHFQNYDNATDTAVRLIVVVEEE